MNALTRSSLAGAVERRCSAGHSVLAVHRLTPPAADAITSTAAHRHVPAAPGHGLAELDSDLKHGGPAS